MPPHRQTRKKSPTVATTEGEGEYGAAAAAAATTTTTTDDDDDLEEVEDLSDSEDGSNNDMDDDDDDDDDDDSDDYDDLDDTLLDEVMNLEKKVETSKGRDYGAHAKLLLKLRQAKLKERLEESRVAFDRKFSLSEEQWLSWLEDKMTELKKCASGKKRKEIEAYIQELFERATATLPASVPVWLKYLSFSVAKTSEDTEEDRRQFYERSCKIVAKDYRRGNAFWLAYRAFESSQIESPEKKSRVQAVSTRALETPLEKLDELKEKILAEVENKDERNLYAKAYETGCKRRDLRKAFEDKVEETATKNATIKSDPKANLRAYRSYIVMEKTLQKKERNKELDESIESLYERALLRNPYEVSLWLEYAMEVSSSSSKIDILDRALRACPSSFELLIEKIECCACNSDPQTANIAAMTEAFGDILINSSLKSFKGANDVALAFLRAKWKDKKSDGINNLMKEMHAKLVSQFSNRIRIDPDMKLARYWAQHSANPEMVWKFFLVENEKIYGDYLEAHIQRARYFESSDPQLANRAYELAFSKRNKLSRAVKGKVKDDTNALITRDLCTSWRNFLETSRDSFPSSYEKVKSELCSIDFEKACAPPMSAEDIKRMRREGQIARKRNNMEDDDDDDEGNVKGDEKNKRTKAQDDSKSHVPPASFVPRSEKPREEVIKSLYPNRDQQTAFVKNLDFSVTEEELVTFFDVRKEGKVKARVIKDRHTGRSKGIAYVDFPNEHDLLAAIMHDGEALKGRAMTIAKSRPPPTFSGNVGRGGGRGRVNAPPSSAGRGGLGLVPRAVKQKPKKALADM